MLLIEQPERHDSYRDQRHYYRASSRPARRPCLAGRFHITNQAITAPPHGRKIAWTLTVITQGLPQQADALGECLVSDDYFAPNLTDQLVFADFVGCVAHQDGKQPKRQVWQVDRLLSPAYRLAIQIDKQIQDAESAFRVVNRATGHRGSASGDRK